MIYRKYYHDVRSASFSHLQMSEFKMLKEQIQILNSFDECSAIYHLI